MSANLAALLASMPERARREYVSLQADSGYTWVCAVDEVAEAAADLLAAERAKVETLKEAAALNDSEWRKQHDEVMCAMTQDRNDLRSKVEALERTNAAFAESVDAVTQEWGKAVEQVEALTKERDERVSQAEYQLRGVALSLVQQERDEARGYLAEGRDAISFVMQAICTAAGRDVAPMFVPEALAEMKDERDALTAQEIGRAHV